MTGTNGIGVRATPKLDGWGLVNYIGEMSDIVEMPFGHAER